MERKEEQRKKEREGKGRGEEGQREGRGSQEMMVRKEQTEEG